MNSMEGTILIIAAMVCCLMVIYLCLRYSTHDKEDGDVRELRKIINEQHFYIEYYKRELEKLKKEVKNEH